MSAQSVDWPRLLADLRASGMGIADIEAHTNIAPSTLKGYAAGSHPNYWRGELLIDLWCDKLASGRDQLPMMAVDKNGRRLPINPSQELSD